MRSLHVSLLALTLSAPVFAGAGGKWLGHDRNRPMPPVVSPAVPSTETQVGKAPSDAIVLFDGTNLDKWVSMEGEPTKWVVKDNAMECVPGAGYIRSLEAFGECQLHVEFATPAKAEGKSQGRGNSGVFFGMGRYEVQVLDSYESKTYADGSCASIYNQYPPDVNVSKKPGEWQTYDIIWCPPKFNKDGSLDSPAYLTVIHNGVVVHNHRKLIGETGWLMRAPYKAHAEKLPIAFQDHGNPVRYRNVWVRPLDGGQREVLLPTSTLDKYVGTYKGNLQVKREGDTLLVGQYGSQVALRADSPTTFHNDEVDIHAEFEPSGKWIKFEVGEPGAEQRPRE